MVKTVQKIARAVTVATSLVVAFIELKKAVQAYRKHMREEQAPPKEPPAERGRYAENY